ncbi:hypothetical protein SDJN02_25777, partial [Cucurbita argyrosperma subsp. argyrosperma]
MNHCGIPVDTFSGHDGRLRPSCSASRFRLTKLKHMTLAAGRSALTSAGKRLVDSVDNRLRSWLRRPCFLTSSQPIDSGTTVSGIENFHTPVISTDRFSPRQVKVVAPLQQANKGREGGRWEHNQSVEDLRVIELPGQGVCKN